MEDKLIPRKLDIYIPNDNEDAEDEHELKKHLSTIEEITKIFFKKDYSLNDALIVLDTISSGIIELIREGYFDMEQVSNI